MEEISACAPFLKAQISFLMPRVILCAGAVAAKTLLRTEEGITRLRGRFFEYPLPGGGMIPLLPTFHPSALLRDDRLRAPVWEDLKTLRAHLAELDADYAAMMEGRA